MIYLPTELLQVGSATLLMLLVQLSTPLVVDFGLLYHTL